jgi:hypothetical protein
VKPFTCNVVRASAYVLPMISFEPGDEEEIGSWPGVFLLTNQ